MMSGGGRGQAGTSRIPSQVLRKLFQPLAPPEQTHANPGCPGKGALRGEWYRPLMAAGQSWQSWGEGRERLPAMHTGMKAFMSPACAVSSPHVWLWGGRGSSSACWCALVKPPGSLSPPPIPTPGVQMPLKYQSPHLLQPLRLSCVPPDFVNICLFLPSGATLLPLLLLLSSA